MTPDKFLAVLKRSGIPEGSKDWKDYGEAKRLATRYAQDSSEYERFVELAAGYVGV